MAKYRCIDSELGKFVLNGISKYKLNTVNSEVLNMTRRKINGHCLKLLKLIFIMYSRNIPIKKLKKRTSCVIRLIKLPIDWLFKYFKRLHQRVFLFRFLQHYFYS